MSVCASVSLCCSVCICLVAFCLSVAAKNCINNRYGLCFYSCAPPPPEYNQNVILRSFETCDGRHNFWSCHDAVLPLHVTRSLSHVCWKCWKLKKKNVFSWYDLLYLQKKHNLQKNTHTGLDGSVTEILCISEQVENILVRMTTDWYNWRTPVSMEA